MKLEAKKVFNHFPAIQGQIRVRLGNVVKKTTFDIERRIKISMGDVKTGIEYPRGGGRVHRASAPGEAPAIDYGTLINSITDEFPSDLQGIVFSSVPYSAYLEFGSVKVAARPAWIPAAEAAWPGFIAAMSKIGEGIG